MSLETMTKLASTTVGVGGSSSVTFSNIPQGYTDLKLVVSARTNTARASNGYYYQVTINGATTDQTSRYVNSNGTSTSNGSFSRLFGYCTPSDYTTGVFSNDDWCFTNYSNFTNKTIILDSVNENNASLSDANLVFGLWSNPSPITSLVLTPAAGSFVQYTTATIYGIKNARQTAGNSIKATGGNIVFDGTYVYHVFNATDTFVASQPLTATVVSVGGGGGGGWNNAGGGGGGEVDISSNISVAAGSSNVVVVGSGGATATSTASSGANGTTSSFSSSVTSLGGGGGGTGDASAGLRVGQTGGSGGGGSLDNIGGSASGSNTNAGGQGFAVGSGPERYAGGGGGGATSAGGNADTNARISGTGGQGYAVSNIFSGFTLGGITHLGSGGSGGIYVNGNTGIAGTAGTNAGTGGQQSTSGNVNPTSPTPNAGGGGGGGSYTGVNSRQGSNGGSGIVIVRYKG